MSIGLICLIVGALVLLTIISGGTSSKFSQRKVRLVVVIFGGLLIGFGAYYLGAEQGDTTLGDFQSVDPTQLVVVTSPMDGDSVSCRILTEGTCPKSYNKDIWVLLRPADGKYYPQSDYTSSTYMRDGSWQVITRFGGRKGEIFEINVFEADSLTSAFFSATIQRWKEDLSYPGLADADIPEGASLVERIAVPLAGDCRGVF